MKRQYGPVLLALLSFSLAGCFGKIDRKKILPDLPKEKTFLKTAKGAKYPFRLFSQSEINSIARYEDAAILISRESCSHCQKERKFVDSYIQETESLIYEISLIPNPDHPNDLKYPYQSLVNANENKSGPYAGLYPEIPGTPTWLFYHEGELIATRVGGMGEDYVEFKKNFADYGTPIRLQVLNDYQTYVGDLSDYHHFDLDASGKYLSLSYEALEDTITKRSSEDVSVVYSWRRCSDCRNYDKILYPFLTSHPETNVFTYELDGYYQKKRTDDDESIRQQGLQEFSDFSKRFSLYSDTYYNTDTYGNKAGVAPTIVNYGTSLSQNVFANNMNATRNEDGTLSYGMAFLPEVKALKSKTKVKEGDKLSDNYQKALRELDDLAFPLEVKASQKFLEDHIR